MWSFLASTDVEEVPEAVLHYSMSARMPVKQSNPLQRIQAPESNGVWDSASLMQRMMLHDVDQRGLNPGSCGAI